MTVRWLLLSLKGGEEGFEGFRVEERKRCALASWDGRRE
jgi:hypothetical protein